MAFSPDGGRIATASEENAVKIWDTATGAKKAATLQTGLVVQVPLFVNEGDLLRIDTRTGDYVTRVQ